MKTINEVYRPQKYTEKVVQFGEGNFLRCFVDWQLDRLNENNGFDAGIVILRPIDSTFPPSLNVQEGLYTTMIRGINEEGKVVKEPRVIRSVSREISIYQEYDQFLELAGVESLRYIFSNTTEAGIAFNDEDKWDESPYVTFPGKLTRFLYERYKRFNGNRKKGFIILPCELIDYNGAVLSDMITDYIQLWKLEEDFLLWVEEANTFCSTLVDRIVTGFPGEEIAQLEKELGYKDRFLTTGEYFHLFIIQGPAWLEEEFRLKEANLNIKIVNDIGPYKTRKVGVLNGAHTVMVPVGFLYGKDYVKECIDDPLVGEYIRNALFKEIIPAINMPEKDLTGFAEAVIDRFKNPFIKHQLLSISLNSMTKFRTRVLPQLIAYQRKYETLPERLVFSLAALIFFYRGKREEESFELKDDREFLDLYRKLWNAYDEGQIEPGKIVETVLGLEEHWNRNLNDIPGLKEKVSACLSVIMEKGMKEALKGFV